MWRTEAKKEEFRTPNTTVHTEKKTRRRKKTSRERMVRAKSRRGAPRLARSVVLLDQERMNRNKIAGLAGLQDKKMLDNQAPR